MRAIVHRIGEEDAPAVLRQLHVLEVRPAFGIDADRRADVDLVVVLEALRPHVLPPLDVFRLPVLERALQPLVAREVDVVRESFSAGNHDLLIVLRVGLHVRFQSNSGRALLAVDRQRALFADGVRPLEDPVLPRRQPAEDLRLHRLGAGEAQVGLDAGQRVGRERRARSRRRARTSSSQSISSGANVTSPASSRVRRVEAARRAPAAPRSCRGSPRKRVWSRVSPLLIGSGPPFIGDSAIDVLLVVVVEHVGAVGGERQLEERAGERRCPAR